MVLMSFLVHLGKLCNLDFVHSFQILFSICEICVCVCVCVSDSYHKQIPNME